MKKHISLLLCALMLLLSVQSACAEGRPVMDFYQYPNMTVSRFETKQNITSVSATSQSYSDSELRTMKQSFNKYLDHASVLRRPSSGSVTKAVATDISAKDDSDNPVTARNNEVFVVTLPMNEIVGEGTIVRNVQVFHGKLRDSSTESDSSNPDHNEVTYDWEELDAALTNEEPVIEEVPGPNAGTSTSPGADTTTTSPSTAPSTSPDTSNTTPPTITDYTIANSIPQAMSVSIRPNTRLAILTKSFSPFVSVWEETVLYSDVPQTGDASSAAPWLVLLGGACALLVLRAKKKGAASA